MQQKKSLSRGKSLSLGTSVSTVQAGLGWKPKSSWSSKEADLDASAVLVSGSPLQPQSLRAVSPRLNESVVYFDNLRLFDGSIDHTGDDRTGDGADWMPDEVITVHTHQVRLDATGVIFFVNIHNGVALDLELDEVDKVFWRLDGAGTPIVRDVDREFKDMRSACLGGIFRDGRGGWDAHALSFGSPYEIGHQLTALGVQL